MCFYCCIHPEVDRILDVQTYADVIPCYPSELFFFLKCSYSTPGMTPRHAGWLVGKVTHAFSVVHRAIAVRELSKTLRAGPGGSRMYREIIPKWP